MTDTQTLPSTISVNKLLAVYAVIPVALLLIAVDHYLFGMLKVFLPKRPETWAIWIYIFGLPHVFASFFLIADKEYVDYYGKKLWIGAVALLALPVVLMQAFDFPFMFFFFTGMIVYHTVAQQFGIALILNKRRPDWIHQVNTISGSAAGVVLYILIYAEGYLRYLISPYKSGLHILAWSMAALTLALTIYQITQSKERKGRFYMACNAALILTMVASYNYGLTLLVVVAGRIVHEMTAWIIYASHDKNRNADGYKNIVYRHFAWLKIDPYWIGIVLAFAFGIAATYLAAPHQIILTTLVVSVSLYHYWMETFIWKGSAPPKRYLKFA